MNDVVQDLYVVSSLCIDAAAGFVIDLLFSIVMWFGSGTLLLGLIAMPLPSRFAFPAL